MTKIPRRALVKGGVWAMPAVAVAQAAPAFATSCVPTTESKATAVTWTSAQTSFTGTDPETHVVAYTFSNEGPDSLPVGAELHVHLTYDLIDGEESSTTVNVTSNSVTGRVEEASPVSNGDGTSAIKYDVIITVTQAVESGQGFTFDVTAIYGVVPSGVTESVDANSPYTTTDGCLTTTTVVSVSGSSNGTSYQS